MEIARRVSNFLFGMECLGCGTSSERLDPWLCPACRKALVDGGWEPKFPNADTLSLYPMQPLTRRLVHALKYGSIPGMASYMVRQSSLCKGGDAVDFLSPYAKPFFFVPVPLHRARYRERGYNQAEKIASAFALATGGRVCRWLKRKNFHVSQTKLSRSERAWNVVGAFAANLPARLPPKGTVFVVDDVFTTGATTGACTSALGKDFPLPVKVCTLIYDEPATARMDFVADCRMEWEA